MSGFEVVGVVLGSIPLILEAVGQYGKGVSKIKNMLKYELVFENIDARLQLVRWALRQTCEELLEGLSLPDDEFRNLLDKQEGWESESLKRDLLAWMGIEDYLAFANAAQGINRQIRLLGESLGLDSRLKAPFIIDGKVDSHRRNKFFKARIKISGGFNAKEHDEIITTIQADVNTLRESVKTAHKLERSREARKPSNYSPSSWVVARDHSKRLYRILRSAFLSKHCPSHEHLAQMRFKAPPTKQIGYASCSELTCSFMLKQTSNDNNGIPWEYRHVHLIPHASESQKADDAQESHEIIQIQIHAPTEDLGQDKECRSKTEIGDLCTTLEQRLKGKDCRGFLYEKQWKYHIHEDSCPHSFNIKPGNVKSLRSCLLDTRARLILTSRERRRISLLLASAVLQLHGTGWLGKSWTLDDVFIMENHELYVPRTLNAKEKAPEPTMAHDILRNETLFSLGEALIELTYYRPLLSQDKLTRYSEAVEMAKKLQQDELKNFATAVANCLIPTSSSRLDFDLEDDSFLEWYYQEIVLPLKEDYEVFLADSSPIPQPRVARSNTRRGPMQQNPGTSSSSNGNEGQLPQTPSLSQDTSSAFELSGAGRRSRSFLEGFKTVFAREEVLETRSRHQNMLSSS